MSMKKNINLISIYLLIIFSAILCGCGKTQFTKETHKREDLFARQFEMLTCEKPYGKLCVETEDENEAAKVEGFVNKRLKATGINLDDNKYTLMFVSAVPPKSMALSDQNILVFPIDDVINGDGNNSAQRMIYLMGNCDYWISYGMAYMDTEIDNEALRAYYSDDENLPALNMTGIRFFDYYQDEDECEIAKQTATAVVKYASEKGYKTIDSIASNKSELINGWLSSIGVTDTFDGEYFDKAIYFKNPDDDDLECFRIDNVSILLRKGDVCDIDNIDDLEEYLFYVPDDLSAIRNCIIDNGILDPEEVNRPITCHKNEMKGATYSYAMLDDKIYLEYWKSLPHECVHVYLGKFTTARNNFFNEGVAEYLGSMKYNHAERYNTYKLFQNGLYKDCAGLREINPDEIKSVDDVNLSEIYRLKIKEKEEDENACYPLVDNSGWTYEESGSLVEYIVEHYSFKDFIKAFACEGRTEEENDEIIQKYIDEWRESLKD